MRLRKSVRPPDRYEEEDSSKYSQKNAPKSKFAALATQQIVPFNPHNRPASFPSLDLRQPPKKGQTNPSGSLIKTEKSAVMAPGDLLTKDQLIATDQDCPEDGTSSSLLLIGQQGRKIEEIQEIQGIEFFGKRLDDDLDISDDEDGDHDVNWRDLEPGLQYQIFKNLGQKDIPEIVGAKLRLTPEEYKKIMADIDKRSSHPATVEEIWNYAARSDENIPGFISAEMFKLFLDYLKFASHFEFVHEAQINLARHFMAQHDLDPAEVGEWVPDAAGSGFYILIRPSAIESTRKIAKLTDDQNNPRKDKDKAAQQSILPSRSKESEGHQAAAESATGFEKEPFQTQTKISPAPNASASLKVLGRKRPQKLVLDVHPLHGTKPRGDLKQNSSNHPLAQGLSSITINADQIGYGFMLPTPPATGVPPFDTLASPHHQPLSHSTQTVPLLTVLPGSDNLCVPPRDFDSQLLLQKRQDEVFVTETQSKVLKEASDIGIEITITKPMESSSPTSDLSSLTLSIDKTTGRAEIIQSPITVTHLEQEAGTKPLETSFSHQDCRTRDLMGKDIAPSLSSDAMHAADNPVAFSAIFCNARFPVGEKFMLLSKPPEKRSDAEKWLIYGENDTQCKQNVKARKPTPSLEIDAHWPTVLKDLVIGRNKWLKSVHGKRYSIESRFEQVGLTILGFHDELKTLNIAFDGRKAALKDQQLKSALMEHENKLAELLMEFSYRMQNLFQNHAAWPEQSAKLSEEMAHDQRFDTQTAVLKYLARKRKASQFYDVSDDHHNHNTGTDFPTIPSKKLVVETATGVPLPLAIPPPGVRSSTPDAPPMSPITPPFSPISDDEDMLHVHDKNFLDDTLKRLKIKQDLHSLSATEVQNESSVDTTSLKEPKKTKPAESKRAIATARDHRSGRMSGKGLRRSSRQDIARKTS